MSEQETFYQVVQRAVADLTENGFDSEKRLEYWIGRLREAAERVMTPDWKIEQQLREGLGAIYQRLVARGEVARYHQGVERFTIDKLAPRLHAELDRRIMASANLIKLNRQQSVEKTIQRLSGWATSVPAGGTRATNKTETAANIKKSLAQLPFEQRRVIIDQGHKLTASINDVIANDGGAIALKWSSRWRTMGYNYRKDHKERDGLVYAIRGNWAARAGLMKAGPNGYYDEITAVAEEPFCRCGAVYLYAVSKLPDDMLTDKGRAELARVRKEMAA